MTPCPQCLEDLLPDSTDEPLNSFDRAAEDWLDIDGQRYLKASLVSQHLKADRSKKVVERTLRVRALTLDNLRKHPVELPVDPSGDNVQVGDLMATLVRTTGGEWTLTQWVHCEFFVSFEAIRPVITQQVCGEFFQKVPTKAPTGYFLSESPEFVSKEPTKLRSRYFLNECSKFFQKVPINLIKMYPTIYLAGSL